MRADRGQIEQVIMNLAVNARDAMPEGGTLTLETANVEFDATNAGPRPDIRPGSYVALIVSDTGQGMDHETQSHLFEPFFTTKPPGKGTGLGLSTVFGIVKQSDGQILATSRVGQGTTFKIYLPCVKEAVAASGPSASAAPFPRGSETVLLAEDSEPVRLLIQHLLKKDGYTVLAGASGEEAIRLSDGFAGTIHLLVTDMVMTGMGGKDLAAWISTRRPGIKVLYMSGYTDKVVEANTPFLQKPFAPVDFAKKLRDILDSPRR